MKKLIILAFAAMMVLYMGCSGKKTEDLVVARVEGKELTVRDFEHTAETIESAYLPDTNDLEGKKKVLKYMIAKEVMVLKADDLGLEKDEEFRNFWKRYRDPFLISAITKYYIQERVKLDEKDAEDYFEKMKNEFILSQITVLDSMQAVEIRDEILNGASFEEMARKYSIARSAQDGGRLGTMPIGEMYWWIEEALLGAKKGDITLPVRVNNGYSILKVHDRRKILSDKDMEYAKKRIASIKVKKAMQKVKMEIASDMNFQIFPDVLTIAYNSLPEDVPMGDIFSRKVTYANAPKLDLRDEYKGMILCQYEGNDYTLEDFEYIYENLGLPERPRREQGKEGVVDLLYKKFFNDVLPEYAEKRLNLLEHPMVKQELDHRREQFLITLLYNREILAEVNVSEKEIEEYRDEHEGEIMTKEKREFTVILNSEKDIIEQVKSLADKGETFEDLVVNYSQDPEAKKDKGKKGLNVKGSYPEFDDVAFDLPEEGAISEPFETSRGWAIIKLNRILESKPLNEADSERAIRSILKQKKLDELFEEKIAKWREDYNIEIIDDNLAKAKLERVNKD